MVEPRTEATAPLFQTERQREIAKLTRELGRVEVTDLADRYRVTPETIRRDLSELQEHKVVRRVHGGAVSWQTKGFEPLLSVRNERFATEKRRLSLRAIEELPENGTIIIDSGSTLSQFAEAIPPESNLRIVTNSLLTVQALSDFSGVEVVVLGGKLRRNTMAMVDANAVAEVERFVVDTLFISSDGVSLEHCLTTPYQGEAMLKQAMIRAARRVVALVDHSKFGQDHFLRFAKWDDIDLLITNTEVDPATVAAIESRGTAVVLA